MAKIKNAVESVESNKTEAGAEVKESLNTKIAAIVEVAEFEITDEMVSRFKALFTKAPTKKVYKQWQFASKTFAAKTPLQMQQAILCIEEAGPVDMKTWAEKLSAYDGFKTNQPVERIIAFYKTRMINEGLITVVE